MKNDTLPEFLKLLFWDVEFANLSLEKDSFFIIKRVLDRGTTPILKWLRSKFQDVDIAEVVTQTRDLSTQTANFWSDVLKLDKSQVVCLQKPYSQIPFGLSS